ncbi:MAG: nitroreductase family protein [Promethearchaeota archaeon]
MEKNIKELSIMNVIEKRHSVRNYIDKEIPPKIIKQIARVGRLSPSASNRQPWEFVFITDHEIRGNISVQPFVNSASLIIVGTVDRRITPKWEKVDLAIALQSMVLYCTSIGLGTCYIGWFNENDVRRTCNIPETHKILLLVTVGYEGTHAIMPRIRKDLNKTVYYNTWKQKLPI